MMVSYIREVWYEYQHCGVMGSTVCPGRTFQLTKLWVYVILKKMSLIWYIKIPSKIVGSTDDFNRTFRYLFSTFQLTKFLKSILLGFEQGSPAPQTIVLTTTPQKLNSYEFKLNTFQTFNKTKIKNKIKK